MWTVDGDMEKGDKMKVIHNGEQKVVNVDLCIFVGMARDNPASTGFSA